MGTVLLGCAGLRTTHFSLMTTANLKLIAWAAAGTIGVLMSGYVFLFFQEREALGQGVTEEELKRVLDDVEVIEETATAKVPYEQIRRSMIDLNWTGKLPLAPSDVASEVVAVQPQASDMPLAELVRVTMIVGDGDNPASSFCHVVYLPKAELPEHYSANPSLGVLFVGDRLPDRLRHVIVQDIGPSGVTFAFDDTAREPETLLPPTFDLGAGIVALEDGATAMRRDVDTRIRKVARDDSGAPRKTYEYKPNHYRIGIEDAEYIGENYSEVLAREVRTTKYRNPVTKKYEGIEITSVADGSIAASHGVSQGDVIKSINGHGVTSVSQALNFVKQNQHLYDSWEVVVINKGLEKTVTYQTPPK